MIRKLKTILARNLFPVYNLKHNFKRTKVMAFCYNGERLDKVIKMLSVAIDKISPDIRKCLNNILFNLLKISPESLNQYKLKIFANASKKKNRIIRASHGNIHRTTSRTTHLFFQIFNLKTKTYAFQS